MTPQEMEERVSEVRNDVLFRAMEPGELLSVASQAALLLIYVCERLEDFKPQTILAIAEAVRFKEAGKE